MNKQNILGLYDGALSQYDFRWDEWVPRLINETVINRLSFHLNGEFLNPKKHYALNADLTVNEDFMANYARMVEACSIHGMGVNICLFSQYFEGVAGHPFNGKITAQQLYTNHHGADWTDPKSFYWLWYKSDAQDNVTEWKASSKVGEAIVAMVSRIAKIHGDADKQRPDKTKVWVRAYNETSEKLGEDNRVNDWARQMFLAEGFQKGHTPQFAAVLNPTGTMTTDELNPCVSWALQHGYMFECHSVDDHMDLKGNKQLMVASTDGVKDAQVSGVFNTCGREGWVHRDAKLSETWCGGHFKPDMNKNMEAAMPSIKLLV